MRYIVLLILLLFLSGCVNQNGVSTRYYDDCHTVYDYYGTYNTKCPYNFYNINKDKKKDCLQCN